MKPAAINQETEFQRKGRTTTLLFVRSLVDCYRLRRPYSISLYHFVQLEPVLILRTNSNRPLSLLSACAISRPSVTPSGSQVGLCGFLWMIFITGTTRLNPTLVTGSQFMRILGSRGLYAVKAP
jgi:hypothetical protein